jgi:hypothetical protein
MGIFLKTEGYERASSYIWVNTVVEGVVPWVSFGFHFSM